MDYDFRKGASPYDSSSAIPMYRPPSSYGAHGSPSYYPAPNRIAHTSGPPVSRPPPVPTTSSSPSSSLGIRVAIKPAYRITPPPQLSPQMAEIPRCSFLFDFEFERKILAEAEKESQNWSKIATETPSSSKPTESGTQESAADQLVNKYAALGLNREAVSFAVANYGDNANKVREFVSSYNLLREMGFASTNVARVLVMYDNDRDKALAHFLGSSV
ncbi:uncharacterized protein LOC18424526 [Amborella trichopoda]|uniref:UBA domain-containing protein n=1 Tax=Amborella trichopoda TaxID=13333 RepID=W1NM48_AMBTC|nr:uncharacterized protein LOC18424526 [Amborella trichopoda]ERM96591.1 hypothetical protein AMTR_s00001p00270680 [Amborella trichopoda]|eukprot:XP_006829175.1 uncharacterized protein LOC18424526 [Amborella trichopoda]